MRRRPPRSTRTDTLFPTRRSSDLLLIGLVVLIVLLSQTLTIVPEDKQALVLRFGEIERMKNVYRPGERSEEHTSELQSLMRISYAVFCLKKKKIHNKIGIRNT